jgi:predicted branched-subunit amino acid permease
METTNAPEQPLHAEELPPQQDLFADIADTEPYEKSMNNARIWLYVIAGLQAVMGVIEYSASDDATVGVIACGIDVSIGLLFLGLALYSKKNPVTAFTAALILYLVIVAVAIIIEPSSAIKGIWLKVLAVIALVKANKDARKYAAIKQSLGE